MKSNLFAVLAAISVVACGDATPAPKPPVPITKSSASARVPQTQQPVDIAVPQIATGSASAPTSTPRADAAAQRLSTAASDPTIVEIAGLVMPKSVTWQWEAPSMQFRALQYSVPGSGETAGAAEVVFSVFAAGDGGPIDMNVKRWISQFRADDGSEAVAKIEDRTVNGMKVKWIELAGQYQGMGQATPRPGMAQFGAIIQAPSGTLFIRLVGPASTVEASRNDFEAMVAGVRESK